MKSRETFVDGLQELWPKLHSPILQGLIFLNQFLDRDSVRDLLLIGSRVIIGLEETVCTGPDCLDNSLEMARHFRIWMLAEMDHIIYLLKRYLEVYAKGM